MSRAIINKKKKDSGKIWATLAGTFIVLLMIGLVFLFGRLLGEGYIGSFMFGPSVSSYQYYLEDKYGKDEDFSYAGKYGKNGCPAFDGGFCERVFVSQKTGKEFEVRYDVSEKSFEDQYWVVKNESEINSYYRGIFDEIVPYNYSLSFNGWLRRQDAPIITMDDLLENENVHIEIRIDIDYKDIPDIEGINIDGLKSVIREKADDNPLLKMKDVWLSIYMDDSDHVEDCPDGMLEHGSAGKITKCSSELYSIWGTVR